MNLYFRRGTLGVLAITALLLSATRAIAQGSVASVADSSPFRPLVLPTPNDVRNGAGRPGAKYWQQRADYRITATLDTAAHVLHGKETIHYVNNSPDALPYLWLQVEQNICAPNSITNILNQPPLVFADVSFDFSCGGFTGSPTMESATVNGVDAKRTRYGTTTSHRPAEAARIEGERGSRVRVALHGSRDGRRSHGPGWRALRDRAVVSAHVRV